MFSLMENLLARLDYALRPIRSKSKRLNHISNMSKAEEWHLLRNTLQGTSARMFAWPAPGFAKSLGRGARF